MGSRFIEGGGYKGVKDVKIIALTANALFGDELRCLESGMNAYISKPLKLSTLKQAILTLYEK